MNSDFYRLLAVWFALVAGALGAENFREANRLFEAGEFAAAARTYQNLIDEGGPGAALYYNLGNSHQRLGDYGPAILAYERAKLLAPRDPDLRANLMLARKSATVFDQGKFNPWLEAALTCLSRHEWSWLVAGAALWTGVWSVVFGTGRVSQPLLRKFAVGSLVFAGILIALGSTALVLRSDEDGRGIVLSKDAGVLLSPFEKAESLGTPGAGRIVMMGKKSGGYFHVRVPGTDLEGWMRDGEVARIVAGG